MKWTVLRAFYLAAQPLIERVQNKRKFTKKHKADVLVICDLLTRLSYCPESLINLTTATPYHMKGIEMAKNVYDYKFVRCSLSKADKATFSKWFPEQESLLQTSLKNLLEAGYKVSWSADFENSCYVCTITGNEEKSPNYKKMLSSRSDDHWEAFGLCVFKHVMIFKSELWEDEGSSWG